MADQDSSERRVRLQTVIDRALEAFAGRLPKAMPAKVTKWEPSLQRATVKLLVQRPYVDEEDARQVESVPPIPGVPVQFPGAGGFRVTMPISDGNLIINGSTVPATTGLLVWCDRSIDKWLTGVGGEVDPEFDHQHGLTDAVFLPGLNPFGAPLSNVPTDKMSIGRDTSPSDMEIDGQGNINLANGSNGAARTGDATDLGTFLFNPGSGGSTLQWIPPGGSTGALVNILPVGADLTGKITGGSSKVKIG